MFTWQEVQELLVSVQDIKHCYNTMDLILQQCYLTTDYFIIPVLTFKPVRLLLKEYGMVGVYLANGADDKDTLNHCFVLFQTDQGVVRLESYIDKYNSRVIEFNNYYWELSLLQTAKPGKERLKIWNRLFSGEETYDTRLPLYMEVYTIDK